MSMFTELLSSGNLLEKDGETDEVAAVEDNPNVILRWTFQEVDGKQLIRIFSGNLYFRLHQWLAIVLFFLRSDCHISCIEHSSARVKEAVPLIMSEVDRIQNAMQAINMDYKKCYRERDLRHALPYGFPMNGMLGFRIICIRLYDV